MLIEKKERLTQYTSEIPYLAEGLKCLEAHKNDAAPSRVTFTGGFMMLQEGITKDMDAGDYEAHRKYLDVQVLLQGDETVVWADIADLTETEAYNSDTDKAMYAGEGSAVGIRPGMCYICWPHDAHKACRHAAQPAQYRKAVIKLEIPDVK